LRFQLRWILTDKTKLLMIRNFSPQKFKPKLANLNTNKDSLMMQDSAIFSSQGKDKWLLPIWRLSLLLMLSSLKGNAKIPLLKKYKDKLRDWAQKMIILEFTKTSLMSNLWLRTNLMVAPSMTSSHFLESTLTISLSSKNPPFIQRVNSLGHSTCVMSCSITMIQLHLCELPTKN
jgi:hypothetical protein